MARRLTSELSIRINRQPENDDIKTHLRDFNKIPDAAKVADVLLKSPG